MCDKTEFVFKRARLIRDLREVSGWQDNNGTEAANRAADDGLNLQARIIFVRKIAIKVKMNAYNGQSVSKSFSAASGCANADIAVAAPPG